MRRSRKFCRRGVQLLTFFVCFFLVVERGERIHPNSTKSWPSSAHHRNAIQMVFPWRADGGPTLNVGFVALRFFMGSGPVHVLIRNPIAL